MAVVSWVKAQECAPEPESPATVEVLAVGDKGQCLLLVVTDSLSVSGIALAYSFRGSLIPLQELN